MQRDLQQLGDVCGDGVWLWNVRTGHKFRSPLWYRQLGYAPESCDQWHGPWSTHVHPDDLPAVQAALQDCLQQRTDHYVAEFRMRCRDGRWKWIAARAALQVDENGPLRLYGVHRDIDAQRQLEVTYRENRQSFSAWLELSPDAIAITTAEAQPVYVDVNRAFCLMLGASRASLLGQSAASEHAWSSPAQAEAALDLLLQGVPIVDMPCRLHSRDGRTVHTSLSAQRIQVDGHYRLLIARRDISERVQAEQRLRESEERWRFAIEGHGDALWDWDVTRKTMYRSPRFLELLQLPAHRTVVPLREHSRLFVHDDLPRMSAGFREVLVGQRDELMDECRLRRADGELVWVSYRCRVMQRDTNGRALRLLGTVRDITRQRERQLLLDQQMDRISHSGRLLALGEMASAIAHEINQPLAVIASYAGVLQRKTDGVAEWQALVSKIEEQALRAGHIVWRMRQFARHQDLDLQPLALAQMMEECVQWLRLDSRAAGVRFMTWLPQGLPPVLADRIQIQQVLLNLLRNAVQAMEHSPRKTLVLRARLDVARTELVVDVADRGCGLPQPVALDVFKPFYTTRPDGLGLGLAISQSIVQRHHGRLWSSARAHGGTVFSFSLPLAGGALPEEVKP